MARMRYLTFLKAPGLKLHLQMQFRVISRTLVLDYLTQIRQSRCWKRKELWIQKQRVWVSHFTRSKPTCYWNRNAITNWVWLHPLCLQWRGSHNIYNEMLSWIHNILSKKPSTLLMTHGLKRTNIFMPFPKELVPGEIQTTSCRIWTRHPDSITFDDSLYTKHIC